MDCYLHNAVPSVAMCRTCTHTICATCCDSAGQCPSCRLDERIRAAAAPRERLTGQVGPSNPPPPNPPPQAQPQPPRTQPRTAVLAKTSGETRALVSLGYPLWPLAALALLDPGKSPWVRRQALQAIAFNFGTYGLWIVLGIVAHIPLLGLSAIPILALLIPVWLVASVVFGLKAWNEDDVRVPLISDWFDAQHREAA